MAKFFTIDIQEGCWDTNGNFFDNTGNTAYKKFYSVTDPFKGKIICAYTTDNVAPAEGYPPNFDTNKATEISVPILSQFPNGTVGYIGHDFRFKLGGADSSTYLAIVYNYLHFTSGGGFITVTYSEMQNNKRAYIAGTLEVYEDGSYLLKAYFVLVKDGIITATREIQGDLVIADYKPEGNTSEAQPSDDIGSFDDKSVPISIPNIPTIDMTFGGASGFLNVWRIDQANLVKLGRDLWSTDFIDNIVKSVTNPIDTIITLNIVPSISLVSTASASSTVHLGNFATSASAFRVTSQFFRVDMGSFTFTKYWASALDFNPYTSIQLYLPYIGFMELSPDDVMGRTINVQYTCDIVTGQINALVLVDGGVRYCQAGNFSINVPITGANYGEVYKACVSATVGAVTGVAGAVATGGVAGVISGASILGSATSNAVNGSKIQYNRGGSMSMSAGYLGVQSCFVVITRPKQSLASDYNTFVGYPSNITSVLKDLSGFTSVESIHLENVSATQSEKEELERLLKEGVLL